GHEPLGYLLWNNSLNEDFTAFFLAKTMDNHDGFNHRLALFDNWACAIADHQGRAPQKTTQAPCRYFSPENINAARNFSEECQNLFFRNVHYQPESILFGEWKERFGRHVHQLTAFSLLCNRLGSDSSFFKPHSKPMDLIKYWTTIALPTARRVISSTTSFPQTEMEAKNMETSSLYGYLPTARKTATPHYCPKP
ncbi:MAG: hypothetical protein OEV64_09420, partial [Desulfobulbaceae bacterium]|nr:hypothetical protein [Desulfobulbaceae bacterium]